MFWYFRNMTGFLNPLELQLRVLEILSLQVKLKFSPLSNTKKGLVSIDISEGDPTEGEGCVLMISRGKDYLTDIHHELS